MRRPADFLRSIRPCARHKTAGVPAEHMQRLRYISSASFRRFELSKIAQHLFLATRCERRPILPRCLVLTEGPREPWRHRVLRPVAIAPIKSKLDIHYATHTDCSLGAHSAIQVQIEASVTSRHQVRAPSIFRLAIDAHGHWKRLTPTRFQPLHSGSTNRDKRIDATNLHQRSECGIRQNDSAPPVSAAPPHSLLRRLICPMCLTPSAPVPGGAPRSWPGATSTDTRRAAHWPRPASQPALRST